MSYLLIAVFIPLFFWARLKSESRLLRIARNQNFTYRETLSVLAANRPTLLSYLFTFIALSGTVVLAATGFRLTEDAVPYSIMGGFLVGAAVLAAVGAKQLWRSNRT